MDFFLWGVVGGAATHTRYPVASGGQISYYLFMIKIEKLAGTPVSMQAVEAVERKGLGHPDTIMDHIAEAISIALAREYKKLFGAVMHYNIDKGLLAAGRARKAFWGGKILKPMVLYIGDRATFEAKGVKIPVPEIAIETAKEWVEKNLRFVRPERHMRYRVTLAPGSAQLAEIFSEKGLKGANDTSAAIGYWPLSPLEEAVLSTEQYLNGKDFKSRFPETGEDVKVMGVRRGRDLALTIAMPFVDRFIKSEAGYFVLKEMVEGDIEKFLQGFAGYFDSMELHFNNLDGRGKGESGIYLSVLGTSAEDADSGQVGRGNRVNGLISLCRPMTMEAAAGKNPVSHVGKIYNILSHRLARLICEQVEEVSEAYVLLVSRIGLPVNEPAAVSVKARLEKGAALKDVSKKISGLIEDHLRPKEMLAFTDELSRGKYPVC